MSAEHEYPRTVQLFTAVLRGACYEVVGHERTKMRVKTRDEDRFREPTDDEFNAIRIQEYAERIQAQEVYCLDSCLVSDLMKAGEGLGRDLGDEFSYENVKNLRPDPEDWDLEKCRDWIRGHGMDLPSPDPWSMGEEELRELAGPDPNRELNGLGLEELREHVITEIDAEQIDGIEDYRDMVRDNTEDAEIYEWYRVSKWLAEKLEEIGECVLDNTYGEWWGRQATGQNNIMDGTFQSVARLQLDKYGYH